MRFANKSNVVWVMSLAVGLAVTTMATALTPLGTSFTYQGQLKQSGAAFTGTANIDFKLFDAASLGTQVGSTVSLSGVAVTDGIFTVELDFGASAFDGDARFLDITVDGTPLSPRQPLSGTPYALQTRKLFVDGTNGNVGIGTSSPGAHLHLNRDASNALLKIQSGNSYARLLLDSNGAGAAAFITQNTNANNLRFATGGLARMEITESGNVGIGTISPNAHLHLNRASSNAQLRIQSGNSFARLLLDSSGTGFPAYVTQPGGTNNLGFATNNQPRMTILEDGRVGIGTTAPAVRLSVAGTTDISGFLRVDGALIYANATTNRVGIGRLPTIGRLHVNGRVYATAHFSTSDLRYKQNIVPLSGALQKVLLLRGVSYDWRRAENPEMEFAVGRQCGFIAQEVLPVVPEAVSVDSEGIHSLSSASLIPLLVESIKEQQAQIDILKAQVATLLLN